MVLATGARDPQPPKRRGDSVDILVSFGTAVVDDVGYVDYSFRKLLLN